MIRPKPNRGLSLEVHPERSSTEDAVLILLLIPKELGELDKMLRMIDLGSTNPNLERQLLLSLGSSRTTITNPTETSLLDMSSISINILTILSPLIELLIKMPEESPLKLDPLSSSSTKLSLLLIPPTGT
jgi:hypothetical protein